MATATRSRPRRPAAAPATLTDDEDKLKTKSKHLKDTPRVLVDRPTTGRNTPLGRKTESPASIKTAGPSGQKGKAQHQKLHANK